MKKIIVLLLFLFFYSCAEDNSDNVIKKSGNVEAVEITVSAKTGGTLIQLLKDEGDIVKKGDTVAVLDTKITELEYSKAKALVQAAKAKLKLMKKGSRKEDLLAAKENVKQAKANFELAKKEFERAENLLKEKSLPPNKFDEVNAKFKIAKARYEQAKSMFAKVKNPFRAEETEQAEANLKAAEAQLKILEQHLNDAVITSPTDGVISEVYFRVGETVAPYGNVFEVVNLAEPEIKIYVPETQLGKIKLGQKAEIFSDSFKEKTFSGRVVYISPKAEFTPKTIQTKEERVKLVFEVKIKAENKNLELKTGMPVDVEIKLNDGK